MAVRGGAGGRRRSPGGASVADASPRMAFSLRRQIPESGDDGRVAALFASLSRAAESASAALSSRPEALRSIVDALSTGAALPAPDSRAPPPAAGRGPRCAPRRAVRRRLGAIAKRGCCGARPWRNGLAVGGDRPPRRRLARQRRSRGTAASRRRGARAACRRGRRGGRARAVRCRLESGRLRDARARAPAAALVRAWRLPPLVGATLQGWRRVGEVPSPPAEARAVHFGHAFASQVLFCGVSVAGPRRSRRSRIASRPARDRAAARALRAAEARRGVAVGASAAAALETARHPHAVGMVGQHSHHLARAHLVLHAPRARSPASGCRRARARSSRAAHR